MFSRRTILASSCSTSVITGAGGGLSQLVVSSGGPKWLELAELAIAQGVETYGSSASHSLEKNTCNYKGGNPVIIGEMPIIRHKGGLAAIMEIQMIDQSQVL